MNVPTNPENFKSLVSPELRTTSRIIAEAFDKNHNHVMRDIRKLIEDSREWGVSNFGQTPHVDPQNGQTYQMYEMTRDGYSMLVMGFTGKKATEWKIKFLEAFNAMEQQIKASGGFNLPQNYPDALRLAAEQAEQIDAMRPRVAAMERLEASEGSVGFRVAAKTLSVPERKFGRWLYANGWAFRQGGVRQGYAEKVKAGYLENVPETYDDPTTGESKTRITFKITASGIAKLSELFSRQGLPA